MNKFRGNGAAGAILDEYEKAILELQEIVNSIPQEELIAKVDEQTKDPDCISIQSILTHVIASGYNYAILIRKHYKEEIEYKSKVELNSVNEFNSELSYMFEYNETLFVDYPKLLEEDSTMKTRWGQLYVAEQLLEHAIVHVLRHRRQVEKYLIQLRN